jgi:hypothetical protein
MSLRGGRLRAIAKEIEELRAAGAVFFHKLMADER